MCVHGFVCVCMDLCVYEWVRYMCIKIQLYTYIHVHEFEGTIRNNIISDNNTV